MAQANTSTNARDCQPMPFRVGRLPDVSEIKASERSNTTSSRCSGNFSQLKPGNFFRHFLNVADTCDEGVNGGPL